jgi:hypothetical protein
MPGRRNLRSPFRSITRTGLGLGLALGTGCGGPTCGTDKAPTYGLTASATGVSLVFGAFSASANNDCPMAGAPSGVVSLTLEGSQMGGGGLMTICVPRPDLLASEETAVQIVDIMGSQSDCDYELDPASTPSGSAKGIDECDNGTNKSGFAMDVTGTATLIQECDGTANNVMVTVTGTTAVTAAAE